MIKRPFSSSRATSSPEPGGDPPTAASGFLRIVRPSGLFAMIGFGILFFGTVNILVLDVYAERVETMRQELEPLQERNRRVAGEIDALQQLRQALLTEDEVANPDHMLDRDTLQHLSFRHLNVLANNQSVLIIPFGD